MATYWVSTSGSDANSGTSYANAFATILKAYQSASKGDTINIVNDGTHTSTAINAITLSGFAGTNYDTDPGLVVQGVDSSGNPALTTVVADSGGGTMIQPGDTANYLVVKGIKFDMSGLGSTTGSMFVRYNGSTGSQGPVRIEDCHIIGTSDNDPGMGSAVRVIWWASGIGPSDFGEARYCILQGLSSIASLSAYTTTQNVAIDNCVWWFNNNTTSLNDYLSLAVTAASHVRSFTHNTLYYNTPSETFLGFIVAAPTSGDQGTFNAHSNFLWTSQSSCASLIFGSTTGTATYTGTINYNVCYTAGNFTNGVYGLPWSNGAGANDVIDTTGKSATTVFGNPSSTYNWSGSGNGYTLTVPADLRPKVNTTAGQGGSTPGALPAYESDVSVAVTADVLNPNPNDQVTITVTVTAGSAPMDSASVDYTLPAGLTLVTASTSQGSLTGNTWTVGSLAASASATLTLTVTVDSDQGGNSLVVSATKTTSSPTDPNAANDTDSVTLNVVDTSDNTDPRTDSGSQFVDALPIFGDKLIGSFYARLAAWLDKELWRDVQNTINGLYWREMAVRRVTVPASTTKTINMGGIQRGHHLLVKSDVAVKVSAANQTDAFTAPATFMFVSGGDFESLKINNTSTTTATVHIVAID